VIYIGVFPQRLISLTQKAATASGLKVYSYDQKAAGSKGAGDQPAAKPGAPVRPGQPPAPPPR